MPSRKVLVVDDEPKIIEIVRLYLQREGFEVKIAGDGQTALDMVRKERPDLVILDLNLPEIDGLEVCRTLRRDSNVPIIMLTARTEDVDKLIGLELGADDYITKPFSPREVVARVRAVLRRTAEQPRVQERLVVGDLSLDLARHEARFNSQLLELSPTEFKLLSALMGNPGRVFTRMQLLDLVQGEAYEGYERTIDAHIKNLRRKLASAGPGGDEQITTVRGVGYKLESSSHEQPDF